MKKTRIAILVIGLTAIVGLVLFIRYQKAVWLEKERILQEQISQIKITDMLDYRLTKDVERLDINSIKKKLAGRGHCTKIYEDGTFLKFIDCLDGVYKLELTPPDSYFTLIKLCYLNGLVSLKGYRFHNDGFKKGVWYGHDERGFLDREHNYDEQRGFTFEQVLQFCKDNNIQVNKGWSHEVYFETIIYHGDDPNIWTVNCFDNDIRKFKDIYLDGNTGRILETKVYMPII